MESGYRTIMWGLFLSTFHINIGTFPVLPAFIGWIMITYAIGGIRKEAHQEAFTRAELFAGMISVETILAFTLGFLNYRSGSIQLLSLVYMVLYLLFVYYLMQGSIEYLESHGKTSEAEHYRGIQLCYIIVCVITGILGGISIATGNVGWNGLAGGIGVIMVISLIITVKNIKKIEVRQAELPEG
ncbi:MAG TPA: hypothetical protein GXX75_21490 [Clostridiales bacterium]|nr:hypothetical protein [Clostridiales bacterium]